MLVKLQKMKLANTKQTLTLHTIQQRLNHMSIKMKKQRILTKKVPYT